MHVDDVFLEQFSSGVPLIAEVAREHVAGVHAQVQREAVAVAVRVGAVSAAVRPCRVVHARVLLQQTAEAELALAVRAVEVRDLSAGGRARDAVRADEVRLECRHAGEHAPAHVARPPPVGRPHTTHFDVDAHVQRRRLNLAVTDIGQQEHGRVVADHVRAAVQPATQPVAQHDVLDVLSFHVRVLRRVWIHVERQRGERLGIGVFDWNNIVNARKLEQLGVDRFLRHLLQRAARRCLALGAVGERRTKVILQRVQRLGSEQAQLRLAADWGEAGDVRRRPPIARRPAVARLLAVWRTTYTAVLLVKVHQHDGLLVDCHAERANDRQLVLVDDTDTTQLQQHRTDRLLYLTSIL